MDEKLSLLHQEQGQYSSATYRDRSNLLAPAWPHAKYPKFKNKDYVDLSLFFIILAALTCTPHVLICSLPALFFARQGRREYAAGRESAGERKMGYSLICNILALLVGFAWWTFIVAVVATLAKVLPTVLHNDTNTTEVLY